MADLRHAVGLRNLASQDKAATRKAAKVARPSFKQYRERDGQFYFKLLDASGATGTKPGFASPQEAGRAIGTLRRAAGSGPGAARSAARADGR